MKRKNELAPASEARSSGTEKATQQEQLVQRAPTRPYAQRSDPQITMRRQNNKQSSSQRKQSGDYFSTQRVNDEFPNFINAPTSIANLAQLSGISLLPVNDVDTSQGSWQNYLNSVGNSSGTSNRRPTKQNRSDAFAKHEPAQHSSLALNDTIEPKIDNSSNPLSTFGLATIPCTPMPNQAPVDPFQWGVNSVGAMRSLEKLPKTSAKSHRNNTSKNKGTNQFAESTTNTPYRAENLNLPSNDCLQTFASNSSTFRQPTKKSNVTVHDVLSLPGLSNMIAENNQPDDDDPNVTLLKLMAILNNPALTITPVSGSSTGAVQSSRYDKEITHSTSSNNLSQADLLNEFEDPNFRDPSPEHIDDLELPKSINGNISQDNSQYPGAVQKPSIAKKNRIPRSAVNIQVVYGGPVEPLKQSATNDGNNMEQSTQSLEGPCKIPTKNDQRVNLSWYPGGLSSKNESAGQPDPMINDDVANNFISAAARNFIMDQPASNSNNLPTVSVHMLRHIANQTKDNTWLPNPSSEQLAYEPDSHQLMNAATYNIRSSLYQCPKRQEINQIISSEFIPLNHKRIFKTTKDRLYVPDHAEPRIKRIKREPSDENCALDVLSDIRITEGESRELLISERHLMLERMMPSQDDELLSENITDPDDIFIDRSKRIMSKIDTELERRKKKRFEQISGQVAPSDRSKTQVDNDDEYDDLSDEEETIYDDFITIQLPLDELTTGEKREHLKAVGLMSRDENNRIQIKQCEDKMKLCSPLTLSEEGCFTEDIQRFVDMMLKTGGTDIQLRTDTSIKRSYLPLIEGLNRNTSRVKMTYMSVLGLEKRSKRTTLYKVKPQENLAAINPVPQQQQQQQIDLNISSRVNNTIEIVNKPSIGNGVSVSTNPNYIPVMSDNDFRQLINKQKAKHLSCREAMKAPSKDEYMKSLGLIDIKS